MTINEQRMISRTAELISFIQLHGKPKQHSENEYERSLSKLLERLISAKASKDNRNSSGNVFYPIMQALADATGMPTLFDRVDRKKQQIDNLLLVLEFMKAENREPSRARDTEYKLYCILSNFRLVRSGKLAGIWYEEFDKLLTEYGYFIEHSNERISQDVRDIISFYRKNKKTPSQLSEDPIERKLYNKLIKYRQSRAGKGAQKWNHEIDEYLKNKKIRNIFK